METIDNTQQEMQQQLQQIKAQVNEQQVISDRMLRNAMKWTVHQIKWRTCYIAYISAAFVILLCPALVQVYSLLSTIILMVFIIGALTVTIALHRMLPSMDKDLVHTAQKLIKFKRLKLLYWKITPWIVVFLYGVMIWGFIKAHPSASTKYLIGFIVGVCVGGVVGIIIAQRLHTKIMKKTDALLAQLEELQEE